jgi:hypothetical protein
VNGCSGWRRVDCGLDRREASRHVNRRRGLRSRGHRRGHPQSSDAGHRRDDRGPSCAARTGCLLAVAVMSNLYLDRCVRR